MPSRSGTQFAFTKLLVDDLEATAAFYKEVCELNEMKRVDSIIAGRPISEVVFAATSEGAGTFILLKFLDAPKPTNDEVITGFVTDDLAAFVERARIAGGTIVEDIVSKPQFGAKVAFVADVEGHLMEVVEML